MVMSKSSGGMRHHFKGLKTNARGLKKKAHKKRKPHVKRHHRKPHVKRVHIAKVHVRKNRKHK